jgi:two-component system invasion response regulator UvrY
LEATGEYGEIAEAEDGLIAVQKCRNRKYSIVLLDIHMPNLGGVGALQKILTYSPDQKVIILSSISSASVSKSLIKNGAKGFINKDSSLTEVAEAARKVLAGEQYISPSLLAQIALDSINGVSNNFEKLTKRELEIALAIIEGEKLTKIAERLFISVKSVSTYKARVWQKLNIKSERELYDLAKEQGVIDPKNL